MGRGCGMHGEKKNVYKVMIGKHERRTLERLRCGWEYSIVFKCIFLERFMIFTTVLKGRVFWDVGLCRLVDTDSGGMYVVLPPSGSGSSRQVAVLEIMGVQYR